MAVSVGQVEQLIEKLAPRAWAEDWDNPGLLVGSSAQRVRKILLTLDVTPEVVEEAVKENAELIVSHHPLLFKPLKNLRMDNPSALIPLSLFRNGISCYAAHTNLDQSVLSSSLTFADMLQLEKVEFLDMTAAEKMVKLVTFVPEESADALRLALAAEGVGSGITDGEHSNNYTECFYQTKGEGMFRALVGAMPAIGKIGELTRVPEIRMESIVEERALSRAVKALQKAHPYEEPAYDIIPLQNTGKARGYGAVGLLLEPRALGDIWQEFITRLKNHYTAYDFSSVRLAGDPKKKIRKIAILNGNGSSFVQKAAFKGADLYIVGEFNYHNVLECLESGMAVGELGHFLSEIPMVHALYDYIRADRTMTDAELIISTMNKVPWLKW
ncbi:Nif3-like dinuclear metal center hexameric protein [Dehalobacter sp. DCM]|uniref:Nif3-like dinuclear metal center hexameric protein n=1 Tax=Dehalobacter sp. DCM TaxID=2907827 RepID=UPI0030817017|nr:Nif3-like dinuclear metal center hexameric protein [Dehalobacter sp. DCM]